MARQKKEPKEIQLDDGTNIKILDGMAISKHGKYNKRLLFPNDIFQEDEMLCIISDNDFQKLIQHNTSDTIQEQTGTIKDLSESVTSLKERLQSKDDEIYQLKQELGELNKTIKNQESDMHKKDETIESLSQLKDNIPLKQHQDAIDGLKDDKHKLELQLEKSNGILSTKLAEQKSELSVQHTKEVGELKSKYNILATEYNNLYDSVASISRMDVLLGKHKNLIEDKQHVPHMISHPTYNAKEIDGD